MPETIQREDLIIRTRTGSPPGSAPVEIVERKGLGHPDTLCDAIADRICVRLCRHYLDHFGVILHHNVDKVLLCGGSSRASFGGGEILEPMELYLAGRATASWRGEDVPVHEIAVGACREVLAERVPYLDPDRHARVVSRIRPGSSDLVRLFGRGGAVPLANDSSCGVGFAPLTDLERVVLTVEQRLSDPEIRRAHPAVGSDVKVMGVRRGDEIHLTIGCAFIGRHLAGIDDYLVEKEAARGLALEAAAGVTKLRADAVVNAGDDPGSGDLFLTVIGTSAEAGDDGEVGRGNRTSGLITPYRPMTMEAAAGKNPVNHVGKLYNALASRIAGALADGVPGVLDAAALLVSRIGRSIAEPQLADVQLVLRDAETDELRPRVERIVSDHLAALPSLREELLASRVRLY